MDVLIPRTLARAIVLAALSCAPLEDPSDAKSVKRCPVPCPAQCGADCLPSGYCSRIVVTAGDLNLAPLAAGQWWPVDVAGMPPDAQFSYALHAGLDIVERAGRSPMSMFIAVGPISFRDEFKSFPLWGDVDTIAGSVGSDGVARLQFAAAACDLFEPLTTPGHCSIDPASTFTLTLLATHPFLEAPPCE
jgi:hypothetical protein